MILVLRNKTVTVHQNAVPEDVRCVHIKYSFELGTNHLVPLLHINGHVYRGYEIFIPLDYNNIELPIKVQLLDTNGLVVKEYTSILPYYKTCTIGTPQHVNVYKQIEKLEKTIEELQEKGEVI